MLGRLRQKGVRRVLMTKMTSVCVASDSTNQPVRNSGAWACSTPEQDGERGEVEHRTEWSETDHEASDEARCPSADGRSSISSSTLSVGIVIWLMS